MVLIQDIITDLKVETPSYELEKECIGKLYLRKKNNILLKIKFM